MPKTPSPNASLQVPTVTAVQVPPGGGFINWKHTFNIKVRFLDPQCDGRISRDMLPPDPTIWVYRAEGVIPYPQGKTVMELLSQQWGDPDRLNPRAKWCCTVNGDQFEAWFQDPELHAEFTLRYC